MTTNEKGIENTATLVLSETILQTSLVCNRIILETLEKVVDEIHNCDSLQELVSRVQSAIAELSDSKSK